MTPINRPPLHRTPRRRKGLIHGIAECRVCGWRCENYLTVQKLAAAHARKTGHAVTADLGYVVEYGPTPNNAKLQSGSDGASSKRR